MSGLIENYVKRPTLQRVNSAAALRSAMRQSAELREAEEASKKQLAIQEKVEKLQQLLKEGNAEKTFNFVQTYYPDFENAHPEYYEKLKRRAERSKRKKNTTLTNKGGKRRKRITRKRHTRRN